jgi:hypothetical protein
VARIAAAGARAGVAPDDPLLIPARDAIERAMTLYWRSGAAEAETLLVAADELICMADAQLALYSEDTRMSLGGVCDAVRALAAAPCTAALVLHGVQEKRWRTDVSMVVATHATECTELLCAGKNIVRRWHSVHVDTIHEFIEVIRRDVRFAPLLKFVEASPRVCMKPVYDYDFSVCDPDGAPFFKLLVQLAALQVAHLLDRTQAMYHTFSENTEMTRANIREHKRAKKALRQLHRMRASTFAISAVRQDEKTRYKRCKDAVRHVNNARALLRGVASMLHEEDAAFIPVDAAHTTTLQEDAAIILLAPYTRSFERACDLEERVATFLAARSSCGSSSCGSSSCGLPIRGYGYSALRVRPPILRAQTLMDCMGCTLPKAVWIKVDEDTEPEGEGGDEDEDDKEEDEFLGWMRSCAQSCVRAS